MDVALCDHRHSSALQQCSIMSSKREGVAIVNGGPIESVGLEPRHLSRHNYFVP